MSGLMGWITGNNAQKRKAAPKDAIVALRAHLEMLQKREIHLQNQMDEQQAIAKKNISSNKTGKETPPSPSLPHLPKKPGSNGHY